MGHLSNFSGVNDIEIVILRYLQCGSFHWWGPLIRSLKERHRRNPLGSWKSRKVLIVLDVLKVSFTLYHGKSPSNHHLRDFVLPVPSILSKSKFWDVGMLTVSIKSIGARFCPITPLALCWNYVICKRLYHVIHHHHQKTLGRKICVI